ncbi:MAG: SDR family NAD(P)-dependent oxidoreductase [Clostridia bacterium]|nr:SDR family NAD(P)-dependent oxidoreductase [Clostridia bacterium]
MDYTLITGACGGLGGAFVRVLAERGEPLFLTGRSDEKLKTLSEKLQEEFKGISIKYRACDLTSESDRKAFFEYADGENIKLSRLVYVAGVDTQKAFENYTQEKIIFQTRVNFEGALSFIHASLKRGDLDGKFEVLSISSMSGICPMPYFAIYSATKKALSQFSVALRTELKGKAKVTSVLPGGIPTREDIKQDIINHGFWGKISAKSPRAVAVASLKAVKKNKKTKVVGFWNKVIKFFTDLAPLSLQLRFIKKRWGKSEKDAF